MGQPMNDITISLMALLTIGTILVSCAASWAFTKQAAEQARRKADGFEENLSSFKLDVAKRYVSKEELIKMEERVLGAINRINDRLDRIIDAKVK